MSGDAAVLKYLGESADAYSDIFDNAVFSASDEDKARLIAAIRQLNAGGNLEDTVDIDQVLHYFAVHSFTMNYDSLVSVFAHARNKRIFNDFYCKVKSKWLSVARDGNIACKRGMHAHEIHHVICQKILHAGRILPQIVQCQFVKSMVCCARMVMVKLDFKAKASPLGKSFPWGESQPRKTPRRQS